MHTVPIPVARAATPEPAPEAAPKPETFFASTALSDDYLRAARDAARADPLPVKRPSQSPAAPATPGLETLANAATLQFESVPPVRAPLAEQPPASVLPISMHVDSSWRGADAAHDATQPLAPRARPASSTSWRAIVLIVVSVLALIAIGAAAFVAVRRLTNATEPPAAPGSSSSFAPREPASAADVGSNRATSHRATSDRATSNAATESDVSAQAAELVILGHYREAQPLYAQLAREYPESRAYATLERVLARTRGSLE
jgi:hypothetical protein